MLIVYLRNYHTPLAAYSAADLSQLLYIANCHVSAVVGLSFIPALLWPQAPLGPDTDTIIVVGPPGTGHTIVRVRFLQSRVFHNNLKLLD